MLAFGIIYHVKSVCMDRNYQCIFHGFRFIPLECLTWLENFMRKIVGENIFPWNKSVVVWLIWSSHILFWLSNSNFFGIHFRMNQMNCTTLSSFLGINRTAQLMNSSKMRTIIFVEFKDINDTLSHTVLPPYSLRQLVVWVFLLNIFDIRSIVKNHTAWLIDQGLKLTLVHPRFKSEFWQGTCAPPMIPYKAETTVLCLHRFHWEV